ncbi:hypothetical protein [Citrobacter meridianamericanus]|uniref:hypothetical protein n=1 Tax=Citrobacter meridianamericanus TaxID=2894201 RepID=UPI00351D51CC
MRDKLQGETVVELDSYRERELPKTPPFGGGGSGGGGMAEELQQRVKKLEEDVTDIRVNLATLTARSEHFATKSDISDLRTVMQKELRNQTFAFCTLLLAAVAAVTGIIAFFK